MSGVRDRVGDVGNGVRLLCDLSSQGPVPYTANPTSLRKTTGLSASLHRNDAVAGRLAQPVHEGEAEARRVDGLRVQPLDAGGVAVS